MGGPSQRLCSIFLAVACMAAAEQNMYCGADNCYDVLGVTRGDDSAAIKKAYRKLSMQWHPDKNPDNKDEATKKFQGIAQAYEVLSDDSMKSAYDYYLDHPEEQMYNRMRYYRAVYAPKTPVWSIFFFGSLIFSLLQMFHFREQAKLFLASPMLEEMIEQYYMDNCAGGLHGYQTGELTPEKKDSLKAEFMAQLYEDSNCPLSKPKWSNTLLPCIVFFWPVNGTKWLVWRIMNHKEIEAEKKRVREEKARIEREEREERERIAAELAAKEAKKELGLKLVAERKAAEEAKRAKWQAELEAEQAAEEEEEEETELVVTGKVTAADEMKKKDHVLLEVTYGNNKTAQLVVINKSISIGQEVTIALEGGKGPDGKTVKRSKMGGEWSEAAILSLGGGGGGGEAAPEAPAKEEDGDSEAEAAAQMFAQAKKGDDEEDGKARKRKNKKGK